MYEISWTDEALKGAAFLKKSNPKAFKKLGDLVAELREHPFTGTGHPEPLKYIPGMWSRHIDKKNRIRYTVNGEKVSVYVVAVTGHYGDK